MSHEQALKATHTALSPWDWEFRLYARGNADCLDRATFRLLDENQPLLTYRRQPWPTFVGPAKVAELARVSVGIAALVRAIPRRLFGGDPERISEFYRLGDPALARLLLEEPNSFDGTVGRGDFIDTADGFQCLELNMGANCGGWETGILARLFRQIPAITQFVERARLSPRVTDTVQLLYEHVLDEIARRSIPHDGEVNVAFTSHRGSPYGRGAVFAEYLDAEYREVRRQRAPGLGGRALRCDEEDLVHRRAGIFLGDLRVHAIVEADPKTPPPALFHASKAGSVLLCNGPASYVLTSKRNIALLSEHRDDPCFSAEEQRLIREHVPWTALVSPHFVEYRGERVFLPDLLEAEREHLVLKDSMSAGGSGVHLGWFKNEQQWSALVEAALAAGDWLVQERLDSPPYLYQCGDRGCAPHNVIWGPFVFGDRYAGNVLRMQPASDPGAVNLSISATQGIIFEVPDAGEG